jgi:hypothetical protein
MIRIVTVAFLLVLPSCVAAIGNTGMSPFSNSPAAVPLLQQKVEGARKIVALRQRRFDELETRRAAGQVELGAVLDAEIALEEAKLALLDLQMTLQSAQKRDDD